MQTDSGTSTTESSKGLDLDKLPQEERDQVLQAVAKYLKDNNVKQTSHNDKSYEKAESMTLSGIAVTRTGKLTKHDFFEDLSIDTNKYGDIQFTPSEARSFSNYIRHLNTGVSTQASMRCFPTGTPITMADLSQKDIQDIKVGDVVLTGNGNTKKVTDVFCRQYDGDLVGYLTGKSTSVTIPFSTPEHPFFTRQVVYGDVPPGRPKGRGVDSIMCKGCGRSFETKRLHTRHTKGRTDPSHVLTNIENGRTASVIKNWTESKNLSGCSVSSPLIRLEDPLDFCDDKTVMSLGVVLGYYLAEGSAVHDVERNAHSVQFSFNSNEVSYHNELTTAIVALGYKPRQYDMPEKNSTSIRVHGKDFYNMMTDLGGKYAYAKRISDKVKLFGKAFFSNVLRTLLNGDGCYEREERYACLTTTSRDLAFQSYYIAASLGLNPTLPLQREGSDKGVKVKRRNFWHIYMETAQLLGLEDDRQFTNETRFIESDHLWHAVGEKITKKYSGLVYNLEVEDEHTYVAAGIVVHNCAGNLCPFASQCPLEAMGKAPIGQQCGIEKPYTQERLKTYIEEFDVHPSQATMIVLINKLVQLDLLDLRATMHLAKSENAELLTRNVVGYNNEGDPITQIQFNQALEILNVNQAQRMKILEQMLATPKGRTWKKGYLKEKGTEGYSSAISDIKAKISQIQVVDVSPADDGKPT